MGRHVVRAFGIVPVSGIAIGRQARHHGFEIAPATASVMSWVPRPGVAMSMVVW